MQSFLKTQRGAAWAIVLLALAAARLAPAAEAGLKNGDVVAVCGDSITEQKQYSVLIEDYLLMCQPAAGLRAIQAGWGGEVAPSFFNRMESDVLVFNPTVATTCYGMNDGGYAALSKERADQYRYAQRNIVKKFKAAGVRVIVVGSPGCVDSTTYAKNGRDPIVYNGTLGELRDIAREIASEQNVPFADVHQPMMEVMGKAKAKYGNSYPLAGGDGVHPGPNGHLVMAYAFLKAMGVSGEIGTIKLDMAGKAEASEGHKVIESAPGSVTLESSRYPFCFFGDNPASPDSTRGVLEFFPFNADLNRFQLVVAGLTAPRARVTWGTASKEFSAKALAEGINLAAEFLDNPFCEAFKKVDAAVRDQQFFETPLTKSLLHDMPIYEKFAPESSATMEEIKTKLLAKDKTLFDDAARQVAPVRHTIKVEPLS